MQIVPAKNLVCPLDGMDLTFDEKRLTCTNGHSFDIGRHSYVNLLPVQFKKSKDPGDSKIMVAARSEFISRGYFTNIANKLVEMSLAHVSNDRDICLLDAGCGEGYFLKQVLDGITGLESSGQASFVGLDISKWAIIAASKRTNQVMWIVGTNKRIPVLPSSLDLIYSHFGYPIYKVFFHLLKPGGKIIITEAGPDHLIELRKIIYPHIKSERAESPNHNRYTNVLDCASLTYTIPEIPQQDIHNLLVMTPHLYRATKVGKEAAAKRDYLDLTIDVNITVLNLNPIRSSHDATRF